MPEPLRCFRCAYAVSLEWHQRVAQEIEDSFAGMQSDVGLEWERILFEGNEDAAPDQVVEHDGWSESVLCYACYLDAKATRLKRMADRMRAERIERDG